MQEETRTPSGESPRERHPHDQSLMPTWVPTVIGVILVVMAALAVYTGLRFRNPTLSNGVIKTRRPPRAMTGGGPPGATEAGASLVFSRRPADDTTAPGPSPPNTPHAHPAPARAGAGSD